MIAPRLAAGEFTRHPAPQSPFRRKVFSAVSRTRLIGWRRTVPGSCDVSQAASAVVSTMILLETSGQARPTALLGYPRGHRIGQETQAAQGPSLDYSPEGYSPSNPSVGRIRDHHRRGLAGWRCSAHTQAVCGFRNWGSKSTPFFHRTRTVAAILRATVSRTISGRMPWSSRA